MAYKFKIIHYSNQQTDLLLALDVDAVVAVEGEGTESFGQQVHTVRFLARCRGLISQRHHCQLEDGLLCSKLEI